MTLTILPLSAQTRPATTQASAELTVLVAKLDDPNADTRDVAAEQLMGLHSSDLIRLQSAIRQGPPVSANQVVQLRHIVEHVYLSDLDYPTDPEQSPFLGLYWPLSDGEGSATSGPVRVAIRLPGFDSNRALRDGDSIIAVDGKIVTSLPHDQFVKLVQTYKPGQTVRLTLERHGKVIEVPCRLSSRPAFFSTREVDRVTDWIAQRVKQADSYWQANFAALVKSSPAV